MNFESPLKVTVGRIYWQDSSTFWKLLWSKFSIAHVVPKNAVPEKLGRWI